MKLGFFSALLTRFTFKHVLLKRAYSQEQFREMVSRTPFKKCAIELDPLGLEVSLTK